VHVREVLSVFVQASPGVLGGLLSRFGRGLHLRFELLDSLSRFGQHPVTDRRVVSDSEHGSRAVADVLKHHLGVRYLH